MTCQGVCSVCGAPVSGGPDNGALDIPAHGQEIICLACLCLCVEEEEGDES